MNKKNTKQVRNYIRLDLATKQALEEIARHTFSTKSSLMRTYVRECVHRDAQRFSQETQTVLAATRSLKQV
jgi:predicted transcriptional regulator